MNIKKYLEYIRESSDYPDIPPDIITLVKDCFMSIYDDIIVRFKHCKIPFSSKEILYGVQVNIVPKLKYIKNGNLDSNRIADLSISDLLKIQSCINLCSKYNDMDIIYIRVIHKNPDTGPGILDTYFKDISIKGYPFNSKSLKLDEFQEYTNNILQNLREIIVVFKR